MNARRRTIRRPPTPSWLRAVLADTRGSSAVEYAVAIGTCAIVAALAMVTLGPKLVTTYQSSRHTLIAPVP